MAITTEQVHAAADELHAAGKKTTLEAIREHLGGGSYTTISNAMKAWKERRQLEISSPPGEPMPQALSQRVEQLASGMWAVAVEHAQRRFDDDRDQLKLSLDELYSARDEATDLADRLDAELEQARANLSKLGQEHQQLRSERNQLRTDLAETRELSASAQARTEELRAELNRTHEELRTLRTEASSSLVDATTLRGELKRAQEEMRTFREQLKELEKSPRK